jgi:hypothetical protein
MSRIDLSCQVPVNGQLIQVNCPVVNNLKIRNNKNITGERNLNFALLVGFFYKGYWWRFKPF